MSNKRGVTKVYPTEKVINMVQFNQKLGAEGVDKPAECLKARRSLLQNQKIALIDLFCKYFTSPEFQGIPISEIGPNSTPKLGLSISRKDISGALTTLKGKGFVKSARGSDGELLWNLVDSDCGERLNFFKKTYGSVGYDYKNGTFGNGQQGLGESGNLW